jgi:transposase
MRRFHLGALPVAEEETVEGMSLNHPNVRVRARAMAVLMSHRGLDQSTIAKGLGRCWNFVHAALSNYQAWGFVGLMEHHPGAFPKLTSAQATAVVQWVEYGPSAYHYEFSQWDTRTLQWRIERVFNVTLSREAIRCLLQRKGLRWKRPKSTYFPPDPVDYAQTKAELTELLARAQAGKIVLLLQDEAMATLETTVQCGWSRSGKQPQIPSTGKHSKEHRCAVFGVVNPITGETHYRIFDAINKINMRRFLKHLTRYYGNSKLPVWMVMDNHAAHKKLTDDFNQARIHPHFLKPRCSKLNGIERLWKWLRTRNLHNRFFNTVEELKMAIQYFFCYISGVKSQIIRCVA